MNMKHMTFPHPARKKCILDDSDGIFTVFFVFFWNTWKEKLFTLPETNIAHENPHLSW